MRFEQARNSSLVIAALVTARCQLRRRVACSWRSGCGEAEYSRVNTLDWEAMIRGISKGEKG
jgi:hypothetical protein